MSTVGGEGIGEVVPRDREKKSERQPKNGR
jgi:hypothetical protein